MELKQVASYMNGRYLISNLKKDKKALLSGELLKSCSVDSLGASKQEIQYYDTPELFFATHGINIYTVLIGKSKELIIRYDGSQVQRIDFLKNIPNFFKIALKDPREGITNYFEEINTAIYKVFPEGLHVNIDDMLRNSQPRVIIRKKNDDYRVVNNNGLKTTISFSNSTFINVRTGAKFVQEQLEVLAESNMNKDLFTTFLRSIILDCPQLIRLDNNELTIAINYFRVN